MRNLVQKKLVKVTVIQPEIVEYICDSCGIKFKRGERKKIYYNSATRKAEHYHPECDNKRQGRTV